MRKLLAYVALVSLATLLLAQETVVINIHRRPLATAGGISRVAGGTCVTTPPAANCSFSLTAQTGDTIVAFSSTVGLTGTITMQWNGELTEYDAGNGPTAEQHTFHKDNVSGATWNAVCAFSDPTNDQAKVLKCNWIIVRGAQATPTDKYVPANGTSTAPTASTGTLSQANELVLGLLSTANLCANIGTWTTFTAGQCSSNASALSGVDGSIVTSTNASQACAMSGATSAGWTMICVSFKQ